MPDYTKHTNESGKAAVRRAEKADAEAIFRVTKAAFTRYKDDLHSSYPVPALSESIADIEADIENHVVYVALVNGCIAGSVRVKKLTDELAYVYRFGVSPDINNSGIGSGLLAVVIDDCTKEGVKAIALHTNSRYYKLARYYYGKRFFVHSTSTAKGYIRALFVKELSDEEYNISPAFEL